MDKTTERHKEIFEDLKGWCQEKFPAAFSRFSQGNFSKSSALKMLQMRIGCEPSYVFSLTPELMNKVGIKVCDGPIVDLNVIQLAKKIHSSISLKINVTGGIKMPEKASPSEILFNAYNRLQAENFNDHQNIKLLFGEIYSACSSAARVLIEEEYPDHHYSREALQHCFTKDNLPDFDESQVQFFQDLTHVRNQILHAGRSLNDEDFENIFDKARSFVNSIDEHLEHDFEPEMTGME